MMFPKVIVLLCVWVLAALGVSQGKNLFIEAQISSLSIIPIPIQTNEAIRPSLLTPWSF
jgi:hypothetical protein